MSRQPVQIGAVEAIADIQEKNASGSSTVNFRHKSSGKAALTMQGTNGTKVIQIKADSQQEGAIREMKLRQAVAAAASSL